LPKALKKAKRGRKPPLVFPGADRISVAGGEDLDRDPRLPLARSQTLPGADHAAGGHAQGGAELRVSPEFVEGGLLADALEGAAVLSQLPREEALREIPPPAHPHDELPAPAERRGSRVDLVLVRAGADRGFGAGWNAVWGDPRRE